METAFGTWLQNEVTRQGLTRREIARRLATKHPEGLNQKTLESARRQIYKYLDPERPANPTEPTRRAFAEALGVDPAEIPSDDDEEEEDLHLALLLRACRAKSRRQDLPPRLEEWLRFGIRNQIFEEFSRKELAA